MSTTFEHITVLKEPAVKMLGIQSGMTVIDCTAGGGGHTELILQAVGPSGKVLAFDQDKTAISYLSSKFSNELSSGQLVIVNENFSNLKSSCDRMNVTHVDGIMADIGVSSPQIDDKARGFSFMNDGPLDMRMNQDESVESAENVVNTYDEKELAKIIWQLGEEPKARSIAHAIVSTRQVRPITTTLHLAELVRDAAKYPSKSRKHPATKTFQALRIHVNGELQALKTLVNDGFSLLANGGRMAIISFHSLEDRIVKKSFKDLSQPSLPKEILKGAPMAQAEIDTFTRGKLIKPFPEIPSEDEITSNPRARSAKLRVIEKK